MKNKSKYIIAGLLILSLIFNGLMIYYINETQAPEPSVMKLGNESDVVIYLDRSADDSKTHIDFEKHSITVGSSTILNENNAVYFIGNNGKINLSQYNAKGFVVNSNGELLYKLNTIQ